MCWDLPWWCAAAAGLKLPRRARPIKISFWICTTRYWGVEFLDLVDFEGAAFSVESVMASITSHHIICRCIWRSHVAQVHEHGISMIHLCRAWEQVLELMCEATKKVFLMNTLARVPHSNKKWNLNTGVWQCPAVGQRFYWCEEVFLETGGEDMLI